MEECSAALSWLEGDGLTPVSMMVLNSETNELEKVTMRKDIQDALHLSGEQISEKEADW